MIVKAKMKIQCYALVLALAFFSETAIGKENSKERLVNEFMELVGFESTVRAQVESCKNVMSQSAPKSLLETGDAQLVQRLNDIEIEIHSLCDEIFPLDESRRAYAEKIDARLSEKDLIETIRFFMSPVGQKQSAARGEAIAAWQAVTMGRTTQRLQIMRAQIAKEVQEAVIDFKSRTKMRATK
jgi:hypothetical protein